MCAAKMCFIPYITSRNHTDRIHRAHMVHDALGGQDGKVDGCVCMCVRVCV